MKALFAKVGNNWFWDGFFGDWNTGTSEEYRSYLMRRDYDFKENEKEYKIKLELPGVRRENISIMFEDKKEKTVSIEWKSGEEKMKNAFLIPDGDKDKIVASYKDGMLEVIVPKKEGPETSFQITIS